MKLGLSSAVWYGVRETEAAADYLRTFPLDTCEIFLQTWSEYTEAFGEEVHRRLGPLPCTSVHPKGVNFESDLFSRSDRQTEDAMRMLDRVCLAAERIGARYYVMHGPSTVNTRRKPETIYRLTERMAQARQIAQSHGVEILWENVSWCAVSTPEDVRRMTELIPEQNFVLDVKQARRAGQSELTMAEAMGSHLKHLHVLDMREDGTMCLPGEGCVDFRALLDKARTSGFDGAVILEPYEAQGRDEAAMRRSLDFLRGLIAI